MQSIINKSKNIILGELNNIGNLQIGDKVTKVYQILGVNSQGINNLNVWDDLQKSTLFNSLQNKCDNDKGVNELLSIVILLYTQPVLFCEFQNLEKNTEYAKKMLFLFEMFIPKETISALNEIELTILLLSAYLHSCGINNYEKEKEINKDDALFKEYVDRNESNFRKAEEFIKKGLIEEGNTINNFLMKKYLLPFHHDRIYYFINNDFNDFFVYKGESFCEELCIVSASHIVNTWEFGFKKQIGRSNIDKYRRNKKISGITCNIQFLAICLKIADVLSFNENYFPISILKYIGYDEKVYFTTWLKHLNVKNWQIANQDLIYEIQCTHPVYQHHLFNLIDTIEQEIDKCTYLLADNTTEINNKYNVKISRKINKDYIQSLDFIYGPLNFELDYNRVVSLLMGQQLYGKKNIVVRELLQNSMDACNHRGAIETLHNNLYSPLIEFELKTKGGRYVLVVKDNGIGMDLNIVQNYLINVGSSYYRSKEFEKLKNLYLTNGIEFNPISRFGIGILSCFMISDKIEIVTFRKDEKGESKPLLVLIEGENKFFVIKETEIKEYGTTITLYLSNTTIEDEDTVFDEYNIFTKINKLIEKFAPHINIPIRVNNKYEILPKNYDFSPFIEHTKNIFKDFRISQYEEDCIDLFNPININMSSYTGENLITGIKGCIHMLCLKTNDEKFAFSSESHIILNMPYNNLQCFLVTKKSFIESIENSLGENGTINDKNVVFNWLEQRFGVKSKEDLLRISLYSLTNIFLDRRPSIYESKNVLKNLEEIVNIYRGKCEELKSIVLNISCKGAICYDGVLINDNYTNIYGLYCYGFPMSYDINFTGESKPNLTASRNSIVFDDKYEYVMNNFIKIIAKNIIYYFDQGLIVTNTAQRYYFINKISKRINPSRYTVTYFMFENLDFINKYLTLAVFVDGKEYLLSVPEIIEKYNGEIYIPEYNFVKNVPNVYLNRFGGIVRDIVSRCSDIEFHTFENSMDNYFKIKISVEDLFNPTGKSYNCKYCGCYANLLYLSNQLLFLNKEHDFGRLIDDFKFEKYHKMLQRIGSKIVHGSIEYKNDKEEFCNELNISMEYLSDILKDGEFRKMIKSFKFNSQQFFYIGD